MNDDVSDSSETPWKRDAVASVTVDSSAQV